MTNKLLSLSAALFTVWFSVQAYLNPSDPMFLLKSNSLRVNLILIFLALGSICLSFFAYKLLWQAYLGVLLAAVGIGFFSMLGIVDTHLSFHWPLELWDYFLLLQFSVIYAIGALDVNHEPVPLHLPQLQLEGLLNKLGESLPELPQANITKPTHLQKG